MKIGSEKRFKVLIITVVLLFVGVSINKTEAKYVNKPNKQITSNILKPTYTVASAKTEAFKELKTTLPLISYKSELVDRYYDVNMAYLKKQIYKSSDDSRFLYPSYIGDTLILYGVRYGSKVNNVYYYNSKGNLMRIEIDNNNPDKFPKRIVTYNNKGKLHTVVLYISEKEQYNFDGQGNLVVHWIGERGFNKSGQPIKIKRSI